MVPVEYSPLYGILFALFQSPMSMKSVLQAAWLLTSSFGNLIVILISKVARIPSQVRKHDSGLHHHPGTVVW